MGARAFVNEISSADTQPAWKPGRGLDLPLLVTIIALVLFGLVMMF
jgi:hypothetical protein